MSFDILYSQFLTTISSITLSKLSDEEIKAELFNLAVRAISTFMFPLVDLSYAYDETSEQYYFVNTVTQRELNVILAHMKVEWIGFQISKEEKFQNQYYDKTVSTFSMGNILAQLNRMYENFVIKANKTEYDYGRVDEYGKPRLGRINV